MKKIFILLAAACAMCACTDYLNVKPRGYDIASKIEHYQGLLYGTDLALLNTAFPYMAMECYTDEDGYANAYSTVGNYVCNGYKWNPDAFREDEICGEWNSFTTLLYNYNVIISEVMNAEDGTEEEKLAILSEARMLRAWCTFMMSTFFGEVPIVTIASTQDNHFELKSVEEVNSFVLSEMAESVAHLQDVAEHFFRIFKPTGYGLYGKVLFMLGKYDEAAVQLKECLSLLKTQPSIALRDYRLLMDANGDINYQVSVEENTELLFYVMDMPRLWDSVYASMYNMLMFGVRNDLLELFFPDRKDCRLAFHSTVSSGVSAYKKYSSKETYAANLSNIVTNVGLGLSEVYTMLAECLARSGDTTGAAELLTTLRTFRMDEGHAAIPADIVSADDYVRFAFEERMREQFGFGTSWFDMKRLWNDPLFQYLKPLYVHTVGSETYTFTEDALYLNYPPTVLVWHPEYAKSN
ncbi:MAG: RagB/SusD family nutrient uptake outer membrane protein [Bacteroidales bacterium]|nr:RagB/SusD family nutrient uptake outer membrane protein [Bacteroidales bacterium]